MHQKELENSSKGDKINCTCSSHNNQYLSSISAKDKPWDTHKLESEAITAIFDNIGKNDENKHIFTKWSERTLACSEWLGFCWQEATKEEIILKLTVANLCRVRSCPICSWRRSLKAKARLLERLPKIMEEYPTSRWLFLTLTVRNCDISELRNTVKKMNKGFALMKKRKFWKAIGWIKSIEVTRGKDNSAHPHFHILLHMPASYFQGVNYIKQSKWVEIWQKVMKLDYSPNVDIRSVKPNHKKGKNDLVSVVSEIAKYATKPKTLIENPDWFKIYCIQIHRMRFVDSGGTLRGILADDYDDLINIEEEENLDEEKKEVVRFNWEKKEKHYVRKKN